VIICSGMCTHRPSLSFVVNEISRNQVVVPEGAAVLSIDQIISIEFSFTLSYCVVQFEMVSFCSLLLFIFVGFICLLKNH
jgi:hypothetical protein